LSAKGPVQLMHFQRMTLSFRGRVRSHGCWLIQNVSLRPVGADLSAKGPVQLIHFQRMRLSFRGRVRSHGCWLIQNVSLRPVGADLSAKGPVQLMHFRRMRLSFRGRVRSHGCLFQSKFQCQPLPRVLAPSRGPTSAVDLWERTCPRKGGTADAFPAHETQLSRTSPLPRIFVSITIPMAASPTDVCSTRIPMSAVDLWERTCPRKRRYS